MTVYQLSGGGGGGSCALAPYFLSDQNSVRSKLCIFFYRIVNTEGEGAAEFSSTLSVGEAIVRWLNVRDSAHVRARSCQGVA
jgi:hypothetical protein